MKEQVEKTPSKYEVLKQFENVIPHITQHFNFEMQINNLPLKLQVVLDKDCEDNEDHRYDAQLLGENLMRRANLKLDKELGKSYAKPSLNLIYVLKDLLQSHQKYRKDNNLEIVV